MKKKNNYEQAFCILKENDPSNIRQFFLTFKEDGPHDFATFFDTHLRKNKLRRSDVIDAARLCREYGKKILNQRKHTTNRCVIIRLCIAARMDLAATQNALMLYGMSPLNKRKKNMTPL